MARVNTATTSPAPVQLPSLESILERARRRIEVQGAELAEARARRTAIGSALLREFPGSRTYVNGSVAHGDALTPLSDIDVGVVVAEAQRTHGRGKRGPGDLQARAADAIRTDLKEQYGDLRVELKGRKRSILIRFRDPVAPGRPDFTADVIVAVDNLTGAGLWIPRYDWWDRAHPEAHTQMVLTAIKTSDVTFARAVRLLKHWNRSNGQSLCSWHIKALALGCLTQPCDLVSGLATWFDHAASELARGDTPDPAGVAEHPITIKPPRTRAQVVQMVRRASERLSTAIDLEASGYPTLAHHELALLFNDGSLIARPDATGVRGEEARRLMDQRSAHRTHFPAGAGAAATAHRVPNVRSWSP